MVGGRGKVQVVIAVDAGGEGHDCSWAVAPSPYIQNMGNGRVFWID